MMGFTYNGKHSYNDFKVIAKSVDRPILPALNKKELAIPGRHGTYDFGENNYSNRLISVLLQYRGESMSAMRLMSRSIAAWLSSLTYERLIFDDEPDKYYLAKLYDTVGLESFVRVGVATVQFECQPFALYQVSSGENLTWDGNLTWGMSLAWGNAESHTIDVVENTSIDIDYVGTQKVGLGSPDGSKFDIIITGSFTTLSITLNGKTINYTDAVSGQTVTINNVDATVKLGSTNALANCTGDLTEFLKLVPGTNTASITGTGLYCSVLFDFRAQYL